MLASLALSQFSSTSSKNTTLRVWLNPRLLFLFTFSDLKTIGIPSSIFGVLGSACRQIVVPATEILSSSSIGRWPLVFLWVWMNLLPFNINNQSAPGAAAEDAVNKGWRPLPSGMLSISEARLLMSFWYAAAVLISYILGPLPQCLVLIVLGYWYNIYGGADTNWIVRNGINALGYLSFVTGAITVAAKTPHWTSLGYTWLGIIALIIFTTVQFQDFQDQEGDQARGRRTMPLVVGDSESRVISATVVLLWSWWVGQFWQLGIASLWPSTTLSLIVAFRALRLRSLDSDKLTFRIWNLWIISVYAAPLLAQNTVH